MRYCGQHQTCSAFSSVRVVKVGADLPLRLGSVYRGQGFPAAVADASTTRAAPGLVKFEDVSSSSRLGIFSPGHDERIKPLTRGAISRLNSPACCFGVAYELASPLEQIPHLEYPGSGRPPVFRAHHGRAPSRGAGSRARPMRQTPAARKSGCMAQPRPQRLARGVSLAGGPSTRGFQPHPCGMRCF